MINDNLLTKTLITLSLSFGSVVSFMLNYVKPHPNLEKIRHINESRNMIKRKHVTHFSDRFFQRSPSKDDLDEGILRSEGFEVPNKGWDIVGQTIN